MNPLYNDMQNNQGGGNMLQRFQQFRQNFHGNPQEQVQQPMLQRFQQFQRMFGIK